MLKGYYIIDVDGHVQEPPELWDKRIDPTHRADAPKLQNGKRIYRGRDTNVKLSDAVFQEFRRKTAALYKEYIEMGWGPASQIRAMDQMGIDESFLYPTQGLFMWHIRQMDPGTAAAVVRAYNDWLSEFCRFAPKRLKPVAGVSLYDPTLAIAEVRRAHEQLGIRSLYIRPNPVDGRTLASPDYEPIWTYCESKSIAIGLHEGAHASLATAGQDRFESDFALWSCSHPMEQMMAFLSLLEGGVLQRHPKLRVAFLEAGCGWMPYWLWRLDQRYKNTGFELGDKLTMKPSDYFRRQCWVSLEADEPYIGDMVKWIGDDRILFASDYPHPDHEPDLTEELVELESRLSKRTLKRILEENPRAFYGPA
jgi:predicted TIM-barrel fold metal-dependent hydrolase